MKLHASVGADILSAIDFPYPVVPIVRHHHENWDGSGYPDGLKGTDIPIGARILSVVDCFDALTSDRPYRPKLSDREAIEVLIERRGRMYDPLIVDKFATVHSQIAPDAEQQRQLRTVAAITGFREPAPANTPPLDKITASADEMLTLYELAHGLAGQANLQDIGEATASHLRRLIPFAVAVVYFYDDSTDEIEIKHVVGDAALIGLRIGLGQRLSGWVAANRQTISNSDPVLDLGEIATTTAPPLRNCLSTPLISDGQLVGVLTLYSTLGDYFTEDHRRIIETVATQAAPALGAVRKRDRLLDVAIVPARAQLDPQKAFARFGQRHRSNTAGRPRS
jgi:putative methionine-R-sulfoxide reductase with GAF domain